MRHERDEIVRAMEEVRSEAAPGSYASVLADEVEDLRALVEKEREGKPPEVLTKQAVFNEVRRLEESIEALIEAREAAEEAAAAADKALVAAGEEVRITLERAEHLRAYWKEMP